MNLFRHPKLLHSMFWAVVSFPFSLSPQTTRLRWIHCSACVSRWSRHQECLFRVGWSTSLAGAVCCPPSVVIQQLSHRKGLIMCSQKTKDGLKGELRWFRTLSSPRESIKFIVYLQGKYIFQGWPKPKSVIIRPTHDSIQLIHHHRPLIDCPQWFSLCRIITDCTGRRRTISVS